MSSLAHGVSSVVEVGWLLRGTITSYGTRIAQLIDNGIEFRRLGFGTPGLTDAACGIVDGYLELRVNG